MEAHPARLPDVGSQLREFQTQVIDGIEFRGLTRVSLDTVRAAVHARAGDVYDQDALRRDFRALWNTAGFADIRLETDRGLRGGVIVRFVVTERP